MFKDSPAAQAFVKYLATPEAAQIWAEKGGFASPNKNVDPSVYPDEITRDDGGRSAEAEAFRFDLSDLQPAAFGGTVGQGLLKLFQDFLQNPDDIDGITQQMEDAAAKAYGKLAEADERREHHGGASGLGGLRRSASRRDWRGYLVALRFLAPALVLPRALDRLPGDLHDHPELLRRPRRQFDGFVWFDNYQEALQRPDTRSPRSRTTRSGSGSCPRS